MGDTSNEKGRSLEDAVAMIERTILATDPGLSNRTIRVEARKRINAEGVHHEIDLWVELVASHGYSSLFIFECKNWGSKVSKNEVIVLSEKIRAAQAQRGYLVAREFTSDARAQAERDDRIQLLEVRQEEYARLQPPLSLHYVLIDTWNVEVMFGVPAPQTTALAVDFDHAQAVLDGRPIGLPEYLDPWRAALVDETVGRYPTIASPTGTYTAEGNATRAFAPGAFTLNGHPVESVTLKVIPTFRVVWPAIVSSVEVVGRGRVLALEGVPVEGGEIAGALIEVPCE